MCSVGKGTIIQPKLVGGLDHVLFFRTLGIFRSQLTQIFQRGRYTNHQPDIYRLPDYP